MKTKLTLSVEKEVIETAKEYSKEKGQSLSEIMENYLKLVTVDRKNLKKTKLSTKVSKLRGIIRADQIPITNEF